MSIVLPGRYSHLANDALKEAARRMPVLDSEDHAGKVVKLREKGLDSYQKMI